MPWSAGDRKTMRLCAVVTGLFATYAGLYLWATITRDTQYRFGDFFALWSYPQFVLSHRVADLYDFPALKAAQVALGMETWANNPFPYPPFFMFLLWPLQPLPYDTGYLVWILATLALYLAATWQRDQPLLSLAVLIFPTTAINIVAGQSGFLSAALLLGGLRLMERRPALAGVLFGLLTYKPQFGLLLPVALVAARSGRSIAAAIATTAALAAAATLLFGLAVWADWLHAMPAYAAWFDTLTVRYLMPTVTANLQFLGAPERLVQIVQTTVSLACAIFVWVAFRRFPRPLAIAALLVATCLATPHAFIYDLPMLSSAVLLVIADRLRATRSFALSELAVVVLVLAFPAAMAFGWHAPISSVAMILFAALVAIAGGAAAPRSAAEGNA